MKQLALEYNRTEDNNQVLLQNGFELEKTDYGFEFIYKGRGDSIIQISSDNSVWSILNYDVVLSIVLNFIQDNILKIIEE